MSQMQVQRFSISLAGSDAGDESTMHAQFAYNEGPGMSRGPRSGSSRHAQSPARDRAAGKGGE